MKVESEDPIVNFNSNVIQKICSYVHSTVFKHVEIIKYALFTPEDGTMNIAAYFLNQHR